MKYKNVLIFPSPPPPSWFILSPIVPQCI